MVVLRVRHALKNIYETEKRTIADVDATQTAPKSRREVSYIVNDRLLHFAFGADLVPIAQISLQCKESFF